MNVFIKLFNMSITAGWLIVVVMLLRLILKKAPKSVICFMWLLVGIRLAVPVSFESAFSLVPSSEVFNAETVDDSGFNMNTGLAFIDETVNDYTGKYYEGVTVENGFKRNIVSVTTIVWLAGMTGLLVYAIISYMRLRKKVQTATLFKNNIKQSENIASPFVLGVFRPVIYIPYSINMADMDYIIAHEESHIKRGDHIVKIAWFLILSVYWFNPLVWASYIMLCKDIELACDESVVKKLDEASRKVYSAALLNCAINERKSIIAACPVAFGEVGVKERVKSIMNYKKPAFYIVIVAVVALVVVIVCFMTDPVVKKQEEGNKIYEELTYHGVDENGESFVEVYRFDKKYILKVKDKNGLDPVVDAIGLPNIVLDTTNKKFHFFYDALSSYMNVGSYVIEDDMMIATTDDGLYTYKFKVDGDNLVFVKVGSSSVRIIDSEILGYTIEDGSVFEPDLSAPYRWE